MKFVALHNTLRRLTCDDFVPDPQRQTTKRRKRKTSNNAGNTNNINSRDSGPPSSKQKRSPGPQGFNPVPGVSCKHRYMLQSVDQCAQQQ